MMFHFSHFVREGLLVLVVSISAAVAGGFIATNGRREVAMAGPIAGAITCMAIVFVPSVALRSYDFRRTNRYLLALAWRLFTALCLISILYAWEGVQRKCFIAAMLTCYFVALPLESWLQIKQIQRSSGSQRCERLQSTSTSGKNPSV